MAQSDGSPRLVQRHCGGWLALAPRGASLRIGVSADTADAAKAKYVETVEAWKVMLAGPDRAIGQPCA